MVASKRLSRSWPIVLLALAAACSSTADSEPVQTLKQFYGHLNAGNYPDALALYDAEAREIVADPENMTEDGDFAAWARVETKRGAIDRVEVIDEEPAEGAVRIEFELFYRDGTSRRAAVSVVQEAGGWRMGLIEAPGGSV